MAADNEAEEEKWPKAARLHDALGHFLHRGVRIQMIDEALAAESRMLDVERLAHALRNLGYARPPDMDEVAAEYARLDAEAKRPAQPMRPDPCRPSL